MFGISETELVLIVLFGFLLFGPDKLPGMGRTIGRALKQFRAAQEDFNEVVQSEVIKPMNEVMDADSAAEAKKKEAEIKKALEDDADLASAPAQKTPKRETFAERKRRLEEEKKARERARAQLQTDGEERVSSDTSETSAASAASDARTASAPSAACAASDQSHSETSQTSAAASSASTAAVPSSAQASDTLDKPDLSASALYNLVPSHTSAATEDARKHYTPEMSEAPSSSEAPEAASASAPRAASEAPAAASATPAAAAASNETPAAAASDAAPATSAAPCAAPSQSNEHTSSTSTSAPKAHKEESPCR